MHTGHDLIACKFMKLDIKRFKIIQGFCANGQIELNLIASKNLAILIIHSIYKTVNSYIQSVLEKGEHHHHLRLLLGSPKY